MPVSKSRKKRPASSTKPSQAQADAVVGDAKGAPTIAIHHRMSANDNFETAAKSIWNLVREAVKRDPNVRRVLYLDIDGDRHDVGGFDCDMLKLQQFVMGELIEFLSEAYIPFGHLANPKAQRNDMQEMWTDNDREMLKAAIGVYNRKMLDLAYQVVTGTPFTAGLSDVLVETTIAKIVFGDDRKLAEQMIKTIHQMWEQMLGSRITGVRAIEEYHRRWDDDPYPEIDMHMIALLDDELIEMDGDTGLFYPTKLGMLVQRIIH